MRAIPKIGTKAPLKTGGTGGGMSKAAVAAATSPKAPVKAAKADPGRNMKMQVRRNAKAFKET